MSGTPLDKQTALALLSGKRDLEPKKQKPEDQPARFEIDIRPNPTDSIQCGYPQKGDKGDIWMQWIKQDRIGARELIDRWT